MSIFRLIVISGIFSRKEEDLDILPPPPPFPEIGEEIKKSEQKEKDRAKGEKQRQKEEEKRKAEEIKREQEEKQRREKEKQEQQEADEEKKKQRKEAAFGFFNKLGLVKTEEQKKEAERKKQEEARNREKEAKRKETEKARQEREKKKEEERQKREAEKARIAEQKLKEEENRKKLIEKEKAEKARAKEEESRKKKIQKADEARKKEIKEKTFDFWNKLGLAMTEEEFEKHRKHRDDHKKAKVESGKRLEEHERKLEEERKRLEEAKARKKAQEEKRIQKEIEEHLKAREKFGPIPVAEEPKTAKKPLFGKLFGGETKLDKELKELEKSMLSEKEEQEKIKPKAAAIKEDNYEDEIQKAIEGIKKEKQRAPMFSGFFRKEKPDEKVAMPGVMPMVMERPDSLHSIEVKMHKARLALMEFKLEDAKRLYIEIIGIYNGLEAKEKAKVYNDIKDLYYERKSAEKYAK